MARVVRADREGIALLVVMLLTMVVAAIAAGAALIGANTLLINEYDSRLSLLESVADGGLELGRARLNANPALYSDAGTATLEFDAAVYDADGAAIPGVRRTVYSMPLGGGPGQYGNYAALVAVAQDASGTRVIRRLDLQQESFAVFAYFTDHEPSNLAFANNDQLYGPVHSNETLRIRSSGATFHGPVTTAEGIDGAQYATFLADTATQVTPILMPTTSQLQRLRDRAEPAHLALTAAPGGGPGEATLRILFVSRDVDGDGVEEGFARVYRSPNAAWVSGKVSGDSLGNSPNCGHTEPNGMFHAVAADPVGGHSPFKVLTSSTARCYLGGADELNAHPSQKKGRFFATDTLGSWVAYPGPVHPAVAGEDDGDYLFPLDRRFNPAFRGVIYVDGKVVVSGTVRGRLTLATTDNIIIGDDLVYENDPGAGTCLDMLGLFSGNDIVVADNTVNAPRIAPRTSTYYSFDDSRDEHIHASILALRQFRVENAGLGATATEPCNGTPWGRGCLYVTGGIIQDTRGMVSYGSAGYIKRYTHDTCAFTAPPPYFPSTGHFFRGRYYEVDPVGFSIGEYFDALN